MRWPFRRSSEKKAKAASDKAARQAEHNESLKKGEAEFIVNITRIMFVSGDVEGVDAKLGKVRSLRAADRRCVADALEKAIVEEGHLGYLFDPAKANRQAATTHNSPPVNTTGPLAELNRLVNSREKINRDHNNFLNKLYLAQFHCNCLTLHFIAETKGEAAHPLVKALVQEISALSNEEYNSITAINNAVAKAMKTAGSVKTGPARYTPRQNPLHRFRQG